MVEIAKAIAAICQVIAGDSNTYSSTVAQVATVQVECQAFYAECMKTPKSTLTDCMSKRKKDIEAAHAERMSKLQGK